MPNGIEGLDKLMKKYGELAERTVGNNIVKAVGASAKLVQAEAKTLSPKNQGQLRNSIKSMGEHRDDMVVGCLRQQ